MTAQTWKDADISLDPVRGQKIAVIGYGIQGEAQANNMKDSGLEVIVGLKEGGASWKKPRPTATGWHPLRRPRGRRTSSTC